MDRPGPRHLENYRHRHRQTAPPKGLVIRSCPLPESTPLITLSVFLSKGHRRPPASLRFAAATSSQVAGSGGNSPTHRPLFRQAMCTSLSIRRPVSRSGKSPCFPRRRLRRGLVFAPDGCRCLWPHSRWRQPSRSPGQSGNAGKIGGSYSKLRLAHVSGHRTCNGSVANFGGLQTKPFPGHSCAAISAKYWNAVFPAMSNWPL
jgi:hypothetical protein